MYIIGQLVLRTRHPMILSVLLILGSGLEISLQLASIETNDNDGFIYQTHCNYV